jgi:GH25 family lysozyme M1 (1,4-beta-N-acetylmuramidase)
MQLAQGIDVSMYQPNVAWPTVQQAASISFVLVKASQSNWQDRFFAQHWAGAKGVGLQRGAYHFLTQDVDPLQQAQTYLSALSSDPAELPPILDIEANITDPAKYAAAVQAWLQEVERQLQRHPIIYTAAWWWNPHMIQSGQNPQWAAGYPLWVAHYPLRHGVPTLDQLEQGQLTAILPDTWTRWTFWQYSGDLALLDGITNDQGLRTAVDLNVFNGSVDDLIAFGRAIPSAGATGSSTGGAGTSSGSPPAGGLAQPDPRVTNQVLINAFSHAFGKDYWQVVLRAGLAGLADQRQAEYTGPAIQSLTNLTGDEQAALQQQLAKIVAGP